MRIRMLHQRTGGRYDNQPWPERGGELDVPDEEGAALCEQGIAEQVEQKPPRRTSKQAS